MSKRVGRRLLACVISGLLAAGTAPAQARPADQDLATAQGAPRTNQSFRRTTEEAAALAGGFPQQGAAGLLPGRRGRARRAGPDARTVRATVDQQS